MTYSPTTIAREAAAHLYPDLSNLESIILTAAARMVRESGAREALEPFAVFHECYKRQPMSNVADEFYGIHTGTQYEASIRHSDMTRAAAALANLAKLEKH